MFRATSSSSSGESVVSIQHLVCVTLCRSPSSTQVGKELPDLHSTQSDTYQMLHCVGDRLVRRSGRNFATCILHRVTHTRCCIDTIDSPDDEHEVVRNMYRIEINIWKKNCVSSWLFTRIRKHKMSFHFKQQTTGYTTNMT
jgi:hypothetical protein